MKRFALALPASASTPGTHPVVNGDAKTGDASGWNNMQGTNTTTATAFFSGPYGFTVGSAASSAAWCAWKQSGYSLHAPSR